MITRKYLPSPATIATLLLLAGGICTAPAMADDQVSVDAGQASSAQIEEVSKEQARQANEAAVKEAVDAVTADTELDLDIRLFSRTSIVIAGEA